LLHFRDVCLETLHALLPDSNSAPMTHCSLVR